MKRYIYSKRNELFIIALILLLFLIVFYLFDFMFRAYLLSVSIIIVIYMIYFITHFFTFIDDENKTKQIEILEKQIQQLKNKQNSYQEEIESYFLLWVHQIKTPITASKLLLERKDEDNKEEVLQEIIQIDNYTNLALNYLKIMNESTDMSFKEIELDTIIRKLIKRYAMIFIHNKTKLHYEKIDSIVLTDPKWSTVMIEQILNNALKYAKGNDIYIYFDQITNELVIRDTGIGISESDLPKIFDKGYSGFNGMLDEKSSGVGLYIVRKISRRLNQKVTVDSKLNEYTIFKIKFKQSTTLQ